MKQERKYIQECPSCGNIDEGRVKRGFIREAVHGGPGTAVEFIPVGGKWIWKGTKEIALRILRTDIEKWGDELEKWIFKDIEVEYHCPKCGRKWTETHQLDDSEYKLMIDEYVEKAKELVGLNKEIQDARKIAEREEREQLLSQTTTDMNMKLQIAYKELENFIQEKFKQQIGLAYANAHTISVTKKMWMMDFIVNVSVDQIAGNDIMLRYQANMGLEMIIKGALMWSKEKIAGFVEEQEDNKLLIHLDKIEQLKKALERIEIQSIGFDEENINATLKVKA